MSSLSIPHQLADSLEEGLPLIVGKIRDQILVCSHTLGQKL
jgi:hypothetical protein